MFQQIWQAVNSWRRRLGQIFHIVALIFMGWALWRSLLLLDLDNLQIDYRLIFIAELMIFGVVLMGGLNWGVLAIAFGFEGHWAWHSRTHFLANVSKYLPGSIWGYISKGALSTQGGTSKRQVAGAIFMEVMVAVASGAMLTLLTGQGALAILRLPVYLPKPAWFILSGLSIVTVYLVYRYISQWIPPHRSLPKNAFYALSASIFIFSIGWLLLAVSLAWIVLSIHNQSEQLQVYIFALSLSVVLGVLSVFVPNGIGVREGILVLLLGRLIPLPIAFLSALLLRVGIMIAELIAFLVILFLSWLLSSQLKHLGHDFLRIFVI